MNNNWQNQFSRDASLLAHLVDLPSDQVLISHLSEEDYRKSSFLDQRIITPQLQRQFVPWDALSKVQLPPAPSPHYIFHIGHVGSTLISRLLGEMEGLLALREPQILRNICEVWKTIDEPHSFWPPERFSTRFQQAIGWLSRGFRSDQRVMIKASSFVNEIATQLLLPQSKALFLYVPLQRYIPTILAGEASMQETLVMAGARLQRLNNILGGQPINLWELPPTHRVALSWLSELATLLNAKKALPESDILWMNFDHFLSGPIGQLQNLAVHFNLPLSSSQATQLVSGPIMSSYSKAPEHDYSASLREELLAEASQNHAAPIRSAMLWIGQLADQHPLVAEILELTEKRR
ncbi:hypothetical protein [Parasphingorhabdus halotolerans]|uniref:Sulfotransferase family protein n=1 Tax=Parasphingorhabdus halotolerans TaxID=2725558 RepID=A0A6H2DJ88_9SPHN|nr:hypothetical protein [Parasphingorhabdus halotolerans]QJB68394.1 hypothetical protein HF685_02965 [Parasphingorhabdus halotolerans]